MSRAIKFRAYNKTTKTMLLIFDSTTQKEWYLPNMSGDDWIYIQFTGIHDKTGKEIYEGDTVTCSYRFEGAREIVFNALGTVSTIDGDGSQHSLDMLMLDEIEVVGNIHKEK